jgi:hypothetical protein
MQKTPSFLCTIRSLLATVVERDALLAMARRLLAVKRLRVIHPADLVMALVGCCHGDEERSIASARRLYARLTGTSVEEGAFYDRFTPGLVAMMRELFTTALQKASPAQRDDLLRAVSHAGLKDILGVDASQVSLPKTAAAQFPSTDDELGGIKLTTTLSILLQRVVKVVITDARIHDRKAFKLDRWLHGMLLLFDRGYSDHRLFADIEDRGGFFVTRLKDSIPTLTAIRSGLGQAHVGRRLDDTLPYRGELDVDASFRVTGQAARVFRVIRIRVEKVGSDGRTEIVDVWLVTNLKSEHFSAEQVAVLYRLRWSIEKLFHVLKSVARLDQLRSANSNVIHAFVYAALLGMLLAQNVCAAMHAERPGCAPSIHRVAILVVSWLPDIARAAHSQERLDACLLAFIQALWREGRNPNPGRPYMTEDYIDLLCHAA